jgi:uncharacterized protein (DUF58 family)
MGRAGQQVIGTRRRRSADTASHRQSSAQQINSVGTAPVTGRPPSVGTTSSAEVIRRLELSITRRLDGLLHGDYRGLVPGHGSDPGETRLYQAGDDVRRIDWNVTARTIEPHVRETVADRELETWVVVDASASMAFGTAQCEKRDLALAAVSAVGFLTTRGGNRIGAVLTEQDRMSTVPARSGRLHLQALLSLTHGALTTIGPAAGASGTGGTDHLAQALGRAARTAQRRGLIVVVSDFLDSGDWERPLRVLSARNEVLAVEVTDPREMSLPDIGMVQLVDPETGAMVEVQTSDRRVRRRFADVAASQRDTIARRIRSAGADHLVLSTDRDWLVDLARFVAWRRQRIDALSRVRP